MNEKHILRFAIAAMLVLTGTDALATTTVTVSALGGSSLDDNCWTSGSNGELSSAHCSAWVYHYYNVPFTMPTSTTMVWASFQGFDDVNVSGCTNSSDDFDLKDWGACGRVFAWGDDGLISGVTGENCSYGNRYAQIALDGAGIPANGTALLQLRASYNSGCFALFNQVRYTY